jgi:hypothetical protein
MPRNFGGQDVPHSELHSALKNNFLFVNLEVCITSSKDIEKWERVQIYNINSFHYFIVKFRFDQRREHNGQKDKERERVSVCVCCRVFIVVRKNVILCIFWNVLYFLRDSPLASVFVVSFLNTV